MMLPQFLRNVRLNPLLMGGLLIALPMLVVASCLYLYLNPQRLGRSAMNSPLLPVQSDPIGDKLKTLDAAKARWSRQNISRYRLRIEQGPCHYDAQVQNETVTQTYLNTCSLDAMTVSTLFDQIDHDLQHIKWINGVGCDFLVVYPTYDPIQGYPLKIEYKQEMVSPTNVGQAAFSTLYPSGQMTTPCTLLGILRQPIRVTSLIPLAQTF